MADTRWAMTTTLHARFTYLTHRLSLFTLSAALLAGSGCDEKASGPDDGRAGQATGGSDEPCTPGSEQPCDGEDAGLVQYCLEDGSWGICVDPEATCSLGETEATDCGAGIPGQEVLECVLDADGVPEWTTLETCDYGTEGTTPLALVPAGVKPRLLPAADRFFSLSPNGCNTDWPTADTPWLARDLDGNGRIDGGRELFGSMTRLGGRTARHGFEALAALDANGDGVVDVQDPAFAELVLWADSDGDRISRPGELLPLSAAGIDAIPLAFRRERLCDDRGNCGYERVDLGRGAQIVDLYLTCR